MTKQQGHSDKVCQYRSAKNFPNTACKQSNAMGVP